MDSGTVVMSARPGRIKLDRPECVRAEVLAAQRQQR